jgi:putative FmdB family regulatory protein
MPIYEYKCRKCGKEFEITQRITENSLETCPVEICEEQEKGLGEVYRKISKNVGLSFKGSGFYLTDYTNKKSSSATQEKTTSTNTEKPVETSNKPEKSVKETAA